MQVRHSTEHDLPAICDIFEHARQYMREHGNLNQWVDGYPSKDIILEDIKLNRSYVLVDENHQIIATMMYEIADDPTYEVIKGAWLNDEPTGVIHRIATKINQKGVASFMIDWALNQCPNLKIDTHQDNVPMLRLLRKHNFTQCGNIFLTSGEPRIAFQKTRRREP